MIRKPITFPGHEPLTHRRAALLVQTASRYNSRLMIEHDAKLVNAKSMLGLLSLGQDSQTGMHFLADGDDEKAAAEAIEVLLSSKDMLQ